MPELLTGLKAEGAVEQLLVGAERRRGLEKHAVGEVILRFSGIEGDCHAGLTRQSDSRMVKQHRRGTEVRNSRQLSLVSQEELAEIAIRMAVPAIKPQWLGANLVVSGIADLTLLPPASRLQFPSGATIVIDAENHPCRYPAEIIARHHPDAKLPFVKAAMHKRGLVAWVEAEGIVRPADKIRVWIPPQRIYAHR